MISSRSLILSLIFILSLLSQMKTFAQNQREAFGFKHPDCETRVPEKDHFLQELFLKTLKERGYKPKPIKTSAPLRIGEIYMTYQQTHPEGILFKTCLVQLSLKRARVQGGSKNDKVLYEHQVTRKFPRVTFKGKERCKKALQDSFVHIPHCLRPQAP